MVLSKFLYMFAKDVTFFIRDIRSFILLFLTPIIIVILVGVAFISIQPSNVPIIICGQDSKLYRDTTLLIKGSGIFDVMDIQAVNNAVCEEVISQNIKNSVARAGVIVPPEGLNMTIKIIVDNTKPVSTYIESYFNLITRDLSERLINAMILSLWSNVNNVSDEIESVHSELISYSTDMKSVANELKSMESDIADIRDRISLLESVKNNIEFSLSSTAGIRTQLSSISFTAISVNQKAQSISNQVSGMAIDPAIKAMILDNISYIQGAMNSIDGMADSAEDGLDSAESALNDALATIEDIDIAHVKSRLSDIESSLSASSSSVMRMSNNLDRMAGDLVEAKRLIMEATGEYSPEYSEPVNSEIMRYFGKKRYIDFVFPTILVMILMMMSTFLSSTSFIRQRNTGLLKRVSITPTSMNFLLVEKTLFNAFISLIPLPFILAAGVLILGVEINVFNVMPIIAICGILSLVFVLLGLIIASFSRVESTAILASLIIVIPMMFLSGAFTPYEAFPPILQQIATSMPITISARLIEGFTFYQLPMEYIGTLFAYLLAYIIAAGIVARILMRRSI